MTRGQAAAIINRIFDIQTKNVRSFKDVPTNYRFAKDIAAMKESGIINGYSDGTFRPNQTMTLAEMAVIVDRAFKLNKQSLPKNAFSDVPKSHWAHDAITAMYATDLTTRFRTDTYKPTAKANRADFSAAVYNAMNAK